MYFDDFNLVELYSNRADDAKLEDSALESKARNMPWETPISSLKWSNFRECYTTARMDQDDSNSSARLLEAKLPIPTKRKREILKLSPRGEDSDSRDYLNSDNKKSRPKEKGLRRLSQRAYNIVCGMHAASYK